MDLYARRSTVKGYRYSADGEFMAQMEGLFPYEETPDQASAIAFVTVTIAAFTAMCVMLFWKKEE